jgi:hypothetical protein
MAPAGVEPRLNLILNYATASSPPRIPVFFAPPEDDKSSYNSGGGLLQHASIDQQLDIAASSFLKHFTLIQVDERKLHIPKVLDWYKNDFLKLSGTTTQTNSQREMLMEVQRLLLVRGGRDDAGEGSKMTKLMESGDVKLVSIMYRKFSWEPQPLGSLRSFDVAARES